MGQKPARQLLIAIGIPQKNGSGSFLPEHWGKDCLHQGDRLASYPKDGGTNPFPLQS